MNGISQYKDAVEAIKTAILQSQYEALKSVNRIQLALYFGVGKYLSVKTRKGAWGTGALKTISSQLQRELPGLRGFSATSLKKMRLFYENWNMLDATSSVTTDEIEIAKSSVTTDDLPHDVSNEITARSNEWTFSDIQDFPVEDFFNVPFTHHVEIYSKGQGINQRYYYIHHCAVEHLSVEALVKIIKEDAYQHQSEMPNNFDRTIKASNLARKAVMMFKDNYTLDFINVEQIGERDKIDVDERVIEKEIIKRVKDFIMTFGTDFSFIGNQYHLEVYAEDFFPDLLFFNRALNSMVVVELKDGAFKPSYLGQLMTYIRILDDKVKKPHENPTIGIVLCKNANKDFVEYIIQDYNKPMGVATYKTVDDMPEPLRKALPDTEELKKLLEE